MAESAVNSGECASDSDGEVPGKIDKMEPQLQKEGMPAIPECAVCLQICVHPARLPCSHVFCFLCLKGLAAQGRRCAMCRLEIPPDYLDHPQLLEYPQTLEKDPHAYKWFYEGRNGWWQYEERACEELESRYAQGQVSCELLICGTVYIVDFAHGCQYSKSDPNRKRKIKRDVVIAPKKGVAGIA